MCAGGGGGVGVGHQEGYKHVARMIKYVVTMRLIKAQ